MINQDDKRAARIRKRKEQRLKAKAVAAAAAAAADQRRLELAQAGEQLCALCEEGGPSPLQRKNRCNDVLLLHPRAIDYQRQSDSMTPLLICALHDRHSTLHSLLYDHNANLTLPTTLNESALFLATTYDNIDTVRILLECADHNDNRNNRNTNTSNNSNNSNNNNKATPTIKQPPQLVDIVPKDGVENSPLHVASKYGRMHLVRLLLSSGADPLLPNLQGEIPVHLACQHGHAKVVEMLLYAQPSLSIQNNKQKTPVDVAHSLVPNNPTLNMILLDFYEREALSRRIEKKNIKKYKKQEQLAQLAQLAQSTPATPLPPIDKVKAVVVDFSRDLALIQPPPSFATQKDKQTYARVSWEYRLSGKTKDEPSSLDHPKTGYVLRFLKCYSLVWPETLFGTNKGLAKNQRQLVSEFVRHTALILPTNKGTVRSVWGQVRRKFVDSHRRHPFPTIESATYFLKELSQSAVRMGDFQTKSTTCSSP